MKYSKSDNQFKRLEWCFGEFIYRPCYPFGKNISAFAVNEKGIGAFFHFLSFIKNSTWRMFNWDCWQKTVEDFHAELYGWIESLPPQIQGNLKLFVIVKNLDVMAENEQLTYYNYQRKYIKSGFKMSVAIRHPSNDKYGIGFRDIFFIFVSKPYGQLIDPIKKLSISAKRII